MTFEQPGSATEFHSLIAPSIAVKSSELVGAPLARSKTTTETTELGDQAKTLGREIHDIHLNRVEHWASTKTEHLNASTKTKTLGM